MLKLDLFGCILPLLIAIYFVYAGDVRKIPLIPIVFLILCTIASYLLKEDLPNGINFIPFYAIISFIIQVFFSLTPLFPSKRFHVGAYISIGSIFLMIADIIATWQRYGEYGIVGRDGWRDGLFIFYVPILALIISLATINERFGHGKEKPISWQAAIKRQMLRV